MKSKEEIKIRRAIQSKSNMPDISKETIESLYTLLNLIQGIECPQCKEILPKVFFSNVRGQILCFRCQFDRIHDYIEENRRRIGGRK